MQQTKIIHVTLGKANPERQNGVNKVVFQLANHQANNGHLATVWGITKKTVVNFEPRSFETVLFQDSRAKFILSKKIINAIKNTPPGVLFHLHGAFLPQLYAVAKSLKKHRHSYIYTPHGAYNEVAMQRSNTKKKIYTQLFEKFIVANATYIHLIGKSELNGLRKVFGNAIKTRLIPNGQTIEQETLKLHTPKQTIHFGFMGRLDIHTKGLDLLIKGFAKFVLTTSSKAQLHIIGDGDQYKLLEKLIRDEGISEYVTMHGALFRKEKHTLLQQLDYFCLTSRNEGLPGVVLEALALGIPCIVSKETNLGEYIDSYDAGYCISKNNEMQIYSMLEHAAINIRSSFYTIQRHNARVLIETQFNWNTLSNQLIEEYHAN